MEGSAKPPFTVMPTLSRRVLRRRPSSRLRRSTIRSSDNFYCPMTRSNRRRHRMSHCSSFWSGATGLRRSWDIGTAPGWNGQEQTSESVGSAARNERRLFVEQEDSPSDRGNRRDQDLFDRCGATDPHLLKQSSPFLSAS